MFETSFYYLQEYTNGVDNRMAHMPMNGDDKLNKLKLIIILFLSQFLYVCSLLSDLFFVFNSSSI